MAQGGADFTLTFRALGREDAGRLFNDPALYENWAELWRARLAEEGATPQSRISAMAAVNPWIIPRNHIVEAVIHAAVGGGFAPFHDMAAALERPFDEKPELARFAQPPLPHERVERTFCGT
jgi:uncharacterized protein YdiU (UPF0061 family)